MGRFIFFAVSSGSSIALSSPNLGDGGSPRIFEGDSLYLYNILIGLATSKDGGVTWTGILPTGVISVDAMAQTSGSGAYSNTVVFTTGISGNSVKYQSSQLETPTGWVTSGSMARDFGAVDAIASYDVLPVIVGNDVYLPKIKIGTTAPPYTFTDGGSGIVSYDPLTDLDAAM